MVEAVFKPKRSAYLAGLIDGDGSFSIRYDHHAGYQLTTCVYSTHRPLMNWLVNQFGGGFRKTHTVGNRKQKYQWYTSASEVSCGVAPYLILKSNQGRIVQQFISLGSERNPEARNDLMLDLQRANDYFVPVVKIRFDQFVSPTKTDYAYLAGLFDAEGSFSIVHHGDAYTSVARISNTDQRIFPWLLSRFRGYMHAQPRKDGRTEGTWILSGKKKAAKEQQLLAIMPYLVVKRHRAIIYLDWIRYCRVWTRAKKDEIINQMAQLNHRGLSPEANMSSTPLGVKIGSDLPGDEQRVDVVTQST